MIEAAERMKAIGKREQDEGAPTSIFGSAAGLAGTIESEEQFRISVYPILCAESPDSAMGLASCLAYLLEQYRDTRVYRCFARPASGDEGSELSVSDYQFEVADWELTGLADNVVVYGRLETGSAGCDLELVVDSSLLDEREPQEYGFAYDSLTEAVGELPRVVEQLMEAMAGPNYEQANIEYDSVGLEEQALESLLANIFFWNLDVYLSYWGVEWEESDRLEQFREVASQSQTLDSEFAAWCLGMMAGQVMQAGLEAIGEVLVPELAQAFPARRRSAAGAAVAAAGLANLGLSDQGIELLEQFLGPEAEASIWTQAIGLLLETADIPRATDTCQRALEIGLAHAALYWQYAQILINAETHEWDIEELLFVDPDAVAEEEQIPTEIVQALQSHIELAPGNLRALQLALTYMIDLEDEALWSYLEQLARNDAEGEFTGDTVDRLLDLPDHDRAYDVLGSVADANPFAHVFLAQLALADDNHTLASETIEACRGQLVEIDDSLELELQRLELGAKLPGFEASFAEVKLLLGSNSQVREEQVDLLEGAVEIAPRMIDLYIVLSRCYLSWKDTDSAQEVLEDAKRRAGEAPQIELGLAGILWARNDREAAIGQLNASLEAFPSDVYLLVQMAHYLIANDQLEDARPYIVRAETTAPSHRAIWQVRHLVAQKMAP